jgi:hypothetical protein
MNLKPKQIKFHCQIICPSGKSYAKGIYKINNINEEDLSFVMDRQTTVIEWEEVRTRPKRNAEVIDEVKNNTLGE